MPIPVAARSMAWAYCHLPAGIAGSNPAVGRDICLLRVLCVLKVEVSETGRSLVQRKSYRLCVCVCVCLCAVSKPQRRSTRAVDPWKKKFGSWQQDDEFWQYAVQRWTWSRKLLCGCLVFVLTSCCFKAFNIHSACIQRKSLLPCPSGAVMGKTGSIGEISVESAPGDGCCQIFPPN